MIKASRLVETIGSQKFKEFLLTPFHFEMLFGEDSYFDGWRKKNMGTWTKYSNDDGVILEVYPETYKIKRPKDIVTYEIPVPKDINEFIEDMYRFNITIYWNKTIDELFEPNEYLNINEIRKYYEEVLLKMNKSIELL